MKQLALAALAALVILSLAEPVSAQYHREPDWLAIAVNDVQNIVPDAIADYDRRNCEGAFISGRYSESCGRYERQRMLGYGQRFEYPDYGYSDRGYGFGGYGYSPRGDGRDYRFDRRYDNRRGDRRRGYHSIATQNNVNAWGGINAAIGAGHLIHDIVQDRKQNRKLDEINARLSQQEQMAYEPPADAQPAPRAVSGTPVLNRTGCDLVLRQADGQLTAVNAGGMVYVANPVGLQSQVLGNGACQVTGTRSADGGSVVLVCQ